MTQAIKPNPNTFTVNLSPTNSSLYSIGTATTSPGTLYGSATSIYTSPGTNGSWSTVGVDTSQSAKISLKGRDADIDINGRSLKQFMEAVEQRLAILQPNTKLEAEWAELKELGVRYRALEKEIEEKMTTWDILKRTE